MVTNAPRIDANITVICICNCAIIVSLTLLCEIIIFHFHLNYKQLTARCTVYLHNIETKCIQQHTE